jgi:hypothetical protein
VSDEHNHGNFNWTHVAVFLAVGALIVALFAWNNSIQKTSNPEPQVSVVGDGNSNPSDSSSDDYVGNDPINDDSAPSGSYNSDIAATSNGNDEVCNDQHGYFLDPDFTDTISTHNEEGWFIHVQFWVNYEDGFGSDSPEWETVLDPGRYLIHPPANAVIQGWVWEYGPNCTREVVEDQMAQSIERRIVNKINTEGVASQDLVNRYFEKVA